MGIIRYDMRINKKMLWEVLEGIISKILSILGSGLSFIKYYIVNQMM